MGSNNTINAIVIVLPSWIRRLDSTCRYVAKGLLLLWGMGQPFWNIIAASNTKTPSPHGAHCTALPGLHTNTAT